MRHLRVQTTKTLTKAMAKASYADTFWARHAIFLPYLNENVSSEKLFFTSLLYIFQQTLDKSVYYRFFTVVLIRF